MNDEFRIAYLRPGQIIERINRHSVVYVPIGPLEWHGPHMPYGTDPLNAQNTAEEVCRRVGGVVWPTLYWGTERERRPDQLESLGFPTDRYIVGMDFPANSIPSCYCAEEIFAMVVRDTVRQAARLGAKLVVLINGHGAENHMAALKRLAVELTNTGPTRVVFRLACVVGGPAGSMGHADAVETALMMHMTKSVDIPQLPPDGTELRYIDHAVVDGGGFDGQSPSHTVPEEYDPRRRSTAELGKQSFVAACDQIAGEVKGMLAGK